MLQIKMVISQSAITLKQLPFELLSKLEAVIGTLVQPSFRPNKNSRFSKPVDEKIFAVVKNEPIGLKLHRNMLGKLRPLFERFLGTDFTKSLVTEIDYLSTKIDIAVRDGWTLRDYQEPVKTFLLNKETNPYNDRPLLISLPTGYGKTSTALISAAEKGERILIYLAPTMIPQWLDNIYKILTVDKKETLVVSGSDSLKGLQYLAHENKLTEKVIIVSNKTYQNYLSAYEEAEGDYEGLGYYCSPENFLQLLGVGVVIVDEIHMSWHFNFRLMLYSTVKHFWALSATLVSGDRFLEKTYELAFPKETRYVQEVTDKYINVIALAYYFESLNGIRYTLRNSTAYNQIEFENSILKNPQRKANFFKMLVDCINIGYLGELYQKGDRCAIYFQSREACTEATMYLKQAFPALSVERFIQGDPDSNLYEPDIRVTSHQMAGTGKDIDKLIWVYTAIAMDSKQGNRQSPGRLRKIEGREVTYCYLFNKQNSKHLAYHRNRIKELLGYLGKNLKEFIYPGTI